MTVINGYLRAQTAHIDDDQIGLNLGKYSDNYYHKFRLIIQISAFVNPPDIYFWGKNGPSAVSQLREAAQLELSRAAAQLVPLCCGVVGAVMRRTYEFRGVLIVSA